VEAGVPAHRNGTVAGNVVRSWALVLGGTLLLSALLLGHHTFSAYYLEEDTIEVEGDIVEFQYRNPHSWVHIQSEDAFGRPKTYAAEWGGTSQLERDGITKNTLRVGDSVRIWASPSRNPNDNRIRLKRIERRADGWQWRPTRRENR
jgi:Family of unknown function (DUF6152)